MICEQIFECCGINIDLCFVLNIMIVIVISPDINVNSGNLNSSGIGMLWLKKKNKIGIQILYH